MDDAAMSPWHEGELAIQRSAGVVERMVEVGRRNVRPFMPEQHRRFFAQLPFLVAGSVDGDDAPWATILAGAPGFVSSPTATTLGIAARPDPDDPAGEGLCEGSAIGLLGIELGSRRRNRANGTVRAAESGSLRIEIEQSFGNCPQYIQLRDVVAVDAAETSNAAQGLDVMDGLDAAARALVEAADTVFVASYAVRDGRRQVDVSHRGGRPGFVRVDSDGTLTVPDFSGNLFFMTLGNILATGKAGIVVPDWATGDLLQLTGDAAVVTAAPEIAAFRGAERLWTLRPRRAVRRRGALRLRARVRADGWSPTTLATGNWREADARLAAAALGSRWRRFRIARIVEESRSIRSFHLAPADGAGLAPALPGQYLAIRLWLPGRDAPLTRSYTLSGAGEDGYRISVKRDGLVSRHLHDALAVGDAIEARAPAGGFTIDAGEARPAVLLAGGIGITPLLAMLRHLVEEGRRTRKVRPATLFYASRDRADRAFDGELAALVAQAGGAVRVVRVLGSGAGAREGADYEAVGRIDMALLARHLSFGDHDFYLCGPPAFAQALYDGLRGLNVADGRIHAESFGPAALRRDVGDAGGAISLAQPPLPPAATGRARVSFVASGREAEWTPAAGSLLDLAEAQGLAPAFGCRSGHCGSCRTRLLAGAVTYAAERGAGPAEGEALICCAVPAEGTAEVRLEL